MLHRFTSGGIVMRWFRDEFAIMEMQVGKTSGMDSYDLIGLEASRVAPRCEGLVMLPHWQGAMAPAANPKASGVLVRALGGGARSRIWKQMGADIIGRPVLTTTNEEAATLRIVILAGKAVGLYSSVEEAAEKMIQIEERFEPASVNRAIYDDIFDTYINLYEALCPLFETRQA
jgi:sugar (pentulose or hexulose) kinase